MSDPAIEVEGVSHRYGARQALDELSLTVDRGEIFALLGPNGSGKTTLFRLLSTLLPPQSGTIRLLGLDATTETARVRAALGVVFQAPGLDRKLTVRENLAQQGRLYGLTGAQIARRGDALLGQLGLAERRDDLVEELSGGLRRRVELAKGMLHGPRLLLLDEPSTGLDPTARNELWEQLRRLRDEEGVTIALTTHLLDEADRADRIAILDEGRRVALDTPGALRATVGGDAITIESESPAELAEAIRGEFALDVQLLDGTLRMEQPDGHQWVGRLAEAFGPRITAITVGKPTLEDVFIDLTGHRFHEQAAT